MNLVHCQVNVLPSQIYLSMRIVVQMYRRFVSSHPNDPFEISVCAITGHASVHASRLFQSNSFICLATCVNLKGSSCLYAMSTRYAIASDAELPGGCWPKMRELSLTGTVSRTRTEISLFSVAPALTTGLHVSVPEL